MKKLETILKVALASASDVEMVRAKLVRLYHYAERLEGEVKVEMAAGDESRVPMVMEAEWLRDLIVKQLAALRLRDRQIMKVALSELDEIYCDVDHQTEID